MPLLLQEKDRDAVVSFLETIVVPDQTGANIMQVTSLLRNLPIDNPAPEPPEEV